MSKWINFTEQSLSKDAKTKTWLVTAKEDAADVLGSVEWRTGWRKYVFFPTHACFEEDCLRDIANFLEERTRKQRATWKQYAKTRA